MMSSRCGLVAGGLVAFAGLILGPAAAFGQSINVDFASDAGAPDAAYAAAGNAGAWNAIAAAPGETVPLVDLAGRLTTVTLEYDLGSLRAIADRATIGDDARLLDDGVGDLRDVMTTVNIEGLRDGAYELLVYGWSPWLPGGPTLVVIDDDLAAPTVIGGAWLGTLVDGVTHATLEVEVTGGRLRVGVAGSMWGAGGFLNGLQLRRAAPADLDGDGLVGTPDVMALVADWGPCAGCPTDLDGNGDVGSSDLLALLDDWG